ncbi:hypothetical protein SELMODRAFT_423262 [Selaginella moellendorffii]|uniref:Uncharacterized protein n=1 Tax=Selaginella moellendorffii TaxID=88036 RepID=D8SL37_SELML|nr:hypothetical protein SELMODRAFT_423262 [Selaginella moellendorffii]
MVPEWLETFLQRDFFSKCLKHCHGQSITDRRSAFCIGCCAVLCESEVFNHNCDNGRILLLRWHYKEARVVREHIAQFYNVDHVDGSKKKGEDLIRLKSCPSPRGIKGCYCGLNFDDEPLVRVTTYCSIDCQLQHDRALAVKPIKLFGNTVLPNIPAPPKTAQLARNASKALGKAAAKPVKPVLEGGSEREEVSGMELWRSIVGSRRGVPQALPGDDQQGNPSAEALGLTNEGKLREACSCMPVPPAKIMKLDEEREIVQTEQDDCVH